MELTREQQLNVFLNTAIESLRDKKESKLGLQIIKWVEEKQKLRFTEYLDFLLTNRLHVEYSIRDLRREIKSELKRLNETSEGSQ